jgi:hypothetical protein
MIYKPIFDGIHLIGLQMSDEQRNGIHPKCYEITPIRLPSGHWVIRREQMADDCATILDTGYYRHVNGQWVDRKFCDSMNYTHDPLWFATQYEDRPSIEFLQQLDKECNGCD